MDMQGHILPHKVTLKHSKAIQIYVSMTMIDILPLKAMRKAIQDHIGCSRPCWVVQSHTWPWKDKAIILSLWTCHFLFKLEQFSFANIFVWFRANFVPKKFSAPFVCKHFFVPFGTFFAHDSTPPRRRRTTATKLLLEHLSIARGQKRDFRRGSCYRNIDSQVESLKHKQKIMIYKYFCDVLVWGCQKSWLAKTAGADCRFLTPSFFAT